MQVPEGALRTSLPYKPVRLESVFRRELDEKEREQLKAISSIGEVIGLIGTVRDQFMEDRSRLLKEKFEIGTGSVKMVNHGEEQEFYASGEKLNELQLAVIKRNREQSIHIHKTLYSWLLEILEKLEEFLTKPDDSVNKDNIRGFLKRYNSDTIRPSKSNAVALELDACLRNSLDISNREEKGEVERT